MELQSVADHHPTYPNCDDVIDRDLNVARSILDENRRNIQEGTIDHTNEEDV